MRPVCVRCRCEMLPKTNDFCVEEMSDTDSPYRIWLTDLWYCVSCGVEIVMGFGKEAWAEHYQPGYTAKRKAVDLQYWPRPDMVPVEVAK